MKFKYGDKSNIDGEKVTLQEIRGSQMQAQTLWRCTITPEYDTRETAEIRRATILDQARSRQVSP